MTQEEKGKKFDSIQVALWNGALGDNLAMSVFCAALIRNLEIEGPDGEDPESA